MKLYNTLSRKKEEFVPLVQGHVKMYSCGPTVYNYFHIGNARPFIIFDTLRRYLEYSGYSVEFVQNFTDIDDKMINKANQEGVTVKELADRYILEYFKDAEGLGINKATKHPRATEEIDSIINLIKTLIQKGFAYESEGDVYFATKSFEEYGKLSHQPLEDLETGARVEVDERKRDAMDFALWKNQKPGEPAWESPWGMGRPGWHIECSAMAQKYLGETIDIHSGGQDLVFPHHENEVAQSEAATGKPFARYWVHNGYINVDNRKMSKSLGNFFTVRDVANEFDYEIIRFFMLTSHYRSPINFSKELMESAKSALERLYNCLENLEFLKENADFDGPTEYEGLVWDKISSYKQGFLEAMEDDLNTADAIAALFDIVREVNTSTKNCEGCNTVVQVERLIDILRELGNILGLLGRKKSDSINKEIEMLVNARQQARQDKNWTLADKIRDSIKEKGYVIEDTPSGVKVSKL